MKFRSNFKVIAPATISDLGCGLDVFGVALSAVYDEVLVKPTEKNHIVISTITSNKMPIPLATNQNAAGIAAQGVLDYLKQEHGLDQQWGLDLSLRKRVAVGHGLGSSAASAVAAAFAVNIAFGSPLSKRELLPFILKGEEVAEEQTRINAIVPALLGGLFLVRDHNSLDFYRLPLIRGLQLVVIYPRNNKHTQKERRANLPAQLPLEIMQAQAAQTAALVQAFCTSNLALLSSAIGNNVVEEYWKDTTPYFEELKEAALSNKALGCTLAGKGTAVFALCKNSLEAQEVEQVMKAVYEQNKIRHTSFVSSIDHEGVIIA
ncbi:MAG: homoserine kinase [Aureispira sp.]